jgi:hypothetical protein
MSDFGEGKMIDSVESKMIDSVECNNYLMQAEMKR